MPSTVLSPAQIRQRRLVGINAETVTDVESNDFPGHFPGEDHAWDVDTFKKNFEIEFHQNDPYNASFSLVGIDASISNAFRRILLAEIPSLAIENVFISSNDSIISDEVLAGRLGLVPLTGPRDAIKWISYQPRIKPSMGEDASLDPNASFVATDRNTIELKLNVKCEWKPGMRDKPGNFSAEELYEHSEVYASDLIFNPQGQQSEIFTGGAEDIRAVNPKILLTKLRPGQELDITCHAVKGIGGDHAKFSPVATASYRLLPVIDIIKPITGADAVKFSKCFPPGVVGLETITTAHIARDRRVESQLGEKIAVVKDPSRDTVSRECLRHTEFQGKVKLGRIRDHFIFAVESTGQIPSDELFIESVMILRRKCQVLKASLDNLMN